MVQTTNNLTSGELRLVDANLNRLREGVRVVEDICRFIYDNFELTQALKNIRHSIKSSLLLEALSNRNIIGDCSRNTISSEAMRKDIKSILIANFKRAEESARVLEEILKLYDISEAEKLKQIRYALYDVEKRLFQEMEKELA